MLIINPSMVLLNLFCSSVIFLSICSTPSQAAKILLFPFQIRSHILTLNAIGNELVKEGHDVYTVMHSRMAKEFNELRSEGLKPLVYKIPDECMVIDSEEYQRIWIKDLLKGRLQRFYDSIAYQVNKQCDHVERDAIFKAQLKSHKFDMAVMDGYDFALCNYLFVSALDIPYVTVTSFEDSLFVRLPSLPSFVPSALMLNSDEMDFRERLSSFFHYFYPQWTKEFAPQKYFNETLFDIYREELDDDITSYFDFPSESLMTFITRGHTLEWPVAHLPTVHSLECITASDVTQMPKGFEEIINGSTYGIVIVSFGTLISYLPDPTMQSLLDAFGSRKETFLIKYSSNSSSDLQVPSNVKFYDWLPQNELLAQPGAQLFINHAGNLGQYEALYHGVPMINMPLFADQHHNAFRVEEHGFGLTMNWKDLSSEKLSQLLDLILDDPSYKEKTREVAYRIRSRLTDSPQTAAYWIGHLLKFGNDHLKSASADLSWSEFWMIDIITFLFTVSATVLTGTIFLVRWLISPLGNKKKKPKQKAQ